MPRLVGVLILAALCMGCHSPTPVYDPFMGRTTVPPPGTAAPMQSAPYYAPAPGSTSAAPPLISAPPASGAALPPGAQMPPMGASSFSPNVSPVAQNAPGSQQPGLLPASTAMPLRGLTAAAPSAIPAAYGTPSGYGTSPAATPSGPDSANFEPFESPEFRSSRRRLDLSASIRSACDGCRNIGRLTDLAANQRT